MKTRVLGNYGLPLSVAATLLLAAVLVACGSSAEPVAEEGQSHPAAHVQEGEGSAASDSAITTASVAPQFTLPSAGGDTFALASFVGDKNVVLVFYRGFW